MKSSFPKRVKHQSKNRYCNANAKFGDHVLEKRFRSICIDILAHISEKLFAKTKYLNLALALQAHFLKWRSSRFGKELFIYNYMR